MCWIHWLSAGGNDVGVSFMTYINQWRNHHKGKSSDKPGGDKMNDTIGTDDYYTITGLKYHPGTSSFVWCFTIDGG
jgi:hypothetical protein